MRDFIRIFWRCWRRGWRVRKRPALHKSRRWCWWRRRLLLLLLLLLLLRAARSEQRLDFFGTNFHLLAEVPFISVLRFARLGTAYRPILGSGPNHDLTRGLCQRRHLRRRIFWRCHTDRLEGWVRGGRRSERIRRSIQVRIGEI
jgi:hypothetical protein